jgi:hypothetical protein
MTYNSVCPKIYILLFLQFGMILFILNSLYVMLCYVIGILKYGIIYPLKLIIYKLYDIPYSMLCYSGGGE